MLRLQSGQVESLWDEVLPEKLRELPEDLAQIDAVVEQIRKRLAGEPIEDRLVSLFDPDDRPIRKGKLGKTTEFGYRVGAEGGISHLKRRHGLQRSRLKGGGGERTWTGWAVFAYNVETYGRYA